MAQGPKQYWRGSVAVLAALTIALPPALAALSRVDQIRETSLSETLRGQFTPATGDPRLIARYAKVSEKSQRNFNFTPALTDGSRKNRAITVVVRARDESSAARTAALAAGRTKAPVAFTPVAYDLGESVGFEKFATPKLTPGIDIRNLPVARAPDQPESKSRFATRMINGSRDPAKASVPTSGQAVDVVGSYSVTRNLDVTAGVRYKSDDRLEPLADSRRDSQAVYVGTQFRF